MRTWLIALAAFVAGSLLILPLAAQTGIFDSLFVDATLTVTGDTDLADDSIQEAEIDIDNAPTNLYFLQWDQAAGKPTWAEIGFDTATFSGAPDTSAGTCPTTAGGVDANGPWAALRPNSQAVSIFATASKPFLNYDLTLMIDQSGSTTSVERLFVMDTDGARQMVGLAAISTVEFNRTTGKTAAYASGPLGFVLQPNRLEYRLCHEISSVWMTPT